MLFTDKVKENKWNDNYQYAINFVAYELGGHFPSEENPQRKLGTGDAKYEELTDKQKKYCNSILTPIANASTDHTNKLEKATKLDTIIKLARVLDDKSLLIALEALECSPEFITLQQPK